MWATLFLLLENSPCGDTPRVTTIPKTDGEKNEACFMGRFVTNYERDGATAWLAAMGFVSMNNQRRTSRPLGVGLHVTEAD